MKFLRSFAQSIEGPPQSLAVFAGAFHPPTLAHWALAEAARQETTAVLWVLPAHFPHKNWGPVGLAQRAEMLLALTAQNPRQHAVALLESNLFFDMAAEVQSHTGAQQVHLLAGEDGAQRLIDWDYGLSPEDKQRFLYEGLRRYPLLSARRGGGAQDWQAPEPLAPFIQWLDLDPAHAGVSSTLVREQIARGQAWQHLVPATIATQVACLYGSASS
jgi:nicotinic acid mononucleotide adenylyltransferase